MINKLKEKDMTGEDIDFVFDRFPEIALIEQDDLMFEAVRVLSCAPDYFWECPATTSDYYHNPHTRSKHGLWVHTKMVVTVFQRLSESWLQMELISENEKDYGLVACLLHDLLKNGFSESYERGDPSRSDHDEIMGIVIDNYTNLPPEVSIAIKQHMGPWYDGDKPSNYLSLLVHTCDMIASSKNITPGIYEPHEDIFCKYPNIPQSDFK